MQRFWRRIHPHSGQFMIQTNLAISAILLVLSLMTGAFSGGAGQPGSAPNQGLPGVAPGERAVYEEKQVNTRLSDAGVLAGKTIVVDPGHGGFDKGAVGVGPTPESENVLAIGYDLKAMLEQAGAKVVLTRSWDKEPGKGQRGQLEARAALANKVNADIFVSIHNDWYQNPQVSGTSTFYFGSGGKKLAEAMQRATVEVLGTNDRGVKYGNFYVLRATKMPAALIEVGFVSNWDEAYKLSTPDYRQKAARGIFYGIVGYFLS